MDAMKLIETSGSGMGAGGTGLAAAAGAFFGSWFGDNTGYGRRGDVPLAAATGAVADTVILDSLNSINSGIGSLGNTLIQGQGNAALTSCQGFNGLNSTVASTAAMTQNTLAQGFAGVNASINSGDALIQNTLAQGFGGLNTAITSQGYESRLATAGLSSELAACCCSTKTAIAAEGAATRQLIQNNLITDLSTQLCDSKSKVAQLENQVAFGASQAAQTQQIINTVIAHLGK